MKKEKIVIIGAGMAGCFLAIALAKKGFAVELYESRPDVRKRPFDSGRSFNLTLYYRGIQAMKKVGVWKDVQKICSLAEGNVAHYIARGAVFDPFDTHGNEVLYTVHRNSMNATLLDAASALPGVKVSFETKCVNIDRNAKTVTFQKRTSPTPFTISADVVVGADGVHSLVRGAIQYGQHASHSQAYEDWGYKEVHISPALAKRMQFRLQATHTWPRVNSLLIAFPNPDMSFTLMFNLPLAGQECFETLKDEKTIRSYVMKYFPDLEPLLPEITQSFVEKPIGSFITIKTSPWFYKDFLVLVGDSAHGCLPFYGQGMCAAFEDCLELVELIGKHSSNWEKVFAEYQADRKPNTDLLGVLSKENFIELRDKSRSPFYILKDKFDTFLSRLFPFLWLPPLYVMIAHGDLPYVEAVRSYKRQQTIERWSGIDLLLLVMSLPLRVMQVIKR
jgi:kynurenine 3-monooxygenase